MNNTSPSAPSCGALAVLISAALFLIVLVSPANAQLRIEWEVVNPFRFIHDAGEVQKLREEFQRLGNPTALEFEQALQKADEALVAAKRDPERLKHCIQQGGKAKDCLQKYWHPSSGWMARIAANNYEKTCWDASNLKFRSDVDVKDCGDTYFHPQKHRVRAWIVGLGADVKDVRWYSNGLKLESPDRCEIESRPACIEFDVRRYDEELGRSEQIGLLAQASDGIRLAETEKPIVVRDRLIAGLGDSFASGEGNPDIPAQFMQNESDRDFFYFWKWRRLPRRDKYDKPQKSSIDVSWLDRRCHRSMYSYQFKAALHYALRNPHEAVTFVSYACSGATTDNIYLEGKQQSPQERMPRGSNQSVRGKIELQLAALKRQIGKRPVDAVLLSTGGNDVGFADYVAYVVTSGKTRLLIGKKPKWSQISDELKTIESNYLGLAKAIAGENGINVRDCEGETRCYAVILTPYPNLFTDGNGGICKVDRNEFTMPFNRDQGRGDRTAELYDMLFRRLETLQLGKGADKLPGWSLAISTRDKWMGHGFCAQDTAALNDRVEERFIMPQRKKWKWDAYRPGMPNAEKGLEKAFEPWLYSAYATRSRWIRLPVDSKLTADQQVRLWKFSFDFLFKDDRSSVMHPTAEGHANQADANVPVLESLFHPNRN